MLCVSAKFLSMASWFMVYGLGFRVSGLGCRVSVLLWFVVSLFVCENVFARVGYLVMGVC